MKKLLLMFFVMIILVSCDLSMLPHKKFTSTRSEIKIKAEGSHKRIDLWWKTQEEYDLSDFEGYNIYRSTAADGVYTKLNSSPTALNLYTDWLGANDGTVYYYKIMIKTTLYEEYRLHDIVSASSKAVTTDEEYLDMVQEATFRFFWDWGHPTSGLARDVYKPGSHNPDNCVTGGSGMGLMAIIVGIERGWITREEGAERALTIMSFLKNNTKRYHGAWAHFVNGKTGADSDNCGDIVETAFVIEGALACHQYFDSIRSQTENKIRETAKYLWETVEWSWYKNETYTMNWSWHETNGFIPAHPVVGFDETMIPYLLGIASPTYGIPADCFEEGWAKGGGANYLSALEPNGIKQYVKSNYGPLEEGMPLFWLHYSFLGFDPNGKQDGLINSVDDVDYADVFKNIALIDRAYCTNNSPYRGTHGFGADMWGLTACYGGSGDTYEARRPDFDDGVIAPTAALSSMPYFDADPSLNNSVTFLKNLYNNYGDVAWGPFGFYDSISFDTDGNVDADWVYEGYVAIDQGPIVVMIENYRTKLFWKLFMSYPDIQALLTTLDNSGWTITPQTY